MNFNIPADIMTNSPYRLIRPQVIIPTTAVAFEMDLWDKNRTKGTSIQANLDGWPSRTITNTAMVRFRSQGLGCTFKCKSCYASTLDHGINLYTEEMIYQVLHVLTSEFVNAQQLEHLTIAAMGLGEPFANSRIIDAIDTLHHYIPEAHFLVSTTGPKNSTPVFQKLINLSKCTVPITLQLSVHSVRQGWRLEFIGDNLHKAQPLKSWTVRELSLRAMEWRQKTGQKPHINLSSGPDFHIWETEDYLEFRKLFPPQSCTAKLSLEGPWDGRTWDQRPHYQELLTKESFLGNLGYETYRYIPEGIDLGGSCGSQLEMPTQPLVNIVPAT